MLRFPTFLALSLFFAGPALAQTTFSTDSNGNATTSQTIGNTTFTNGTTYGQPSSSTSQQIGNSTITNGTIGGQPFSTTSTTIGTVGTPASP
jgi:hypothetical protein